MSTFIECDLCDQEIEGEVYSCDGRDVCESCHEDAYPID